MKPTNYHLFDFLDFDPDLSRDESLWKAYKPTSVYEKDGDICINVPFQKQVLSNDMAPDTTSPREEYTLVIRQYTSGITRLFIGFGEESMTDQSEMLQFSDRVKKLPLQVTQTEGEWLITTQDGIQRALIHVKPPVLDRWSELLPDPQETLDLRLYPDGKREIRLAAYDHFSPPRYDALPLAFCKRNGVKERATLSFESKPDECFAGTGERFAKMDLSGQTFFLKNQDGQGVNNRRTYKNIPFYLSSRMYGTFYHTCAHSKLSLAGQSTRSVQFLSDQAMLDVFIIAGNTMEEILRGYRDLTGYPSMPPLWSFGIWMSRMTYFSADEVNEICDRMRAEHYPCDVIHLDTGWFKTDSSRMYGTFYHTCAHSKLSLAGQSTRSVQFLSDQAMLDVFIIAGNTMEEILRGYRDLTGYPSMPPLWSFGIWMSRMTYFSADEVNEICDRMRAEHYPCDVIHLDTGWFKTDWLCEWKFNEERFPDPKGFIQGLKKKGYRVSLWQLPYVAENAEQIDEARKNDYIAPLTKKQDSEGSNFSALDYAGTIDFTYPKATEWYKGLLKNLLDMGVTCIKTDFGENIHMDALYKGMKPELLNNLYALLYQKAAYEITKDVTGDGIVWARSAWAGCQRYPLHWGGDSCSSWDGMAGSLKGGLHFGLSGFAFWSHDVPGFHTLPNFMNSVVADDVYMRWTQFGVFSSHIRYHGTNKREPWHYPAIAPIIKKWWKLRYTLIPYIIAQSRKAISSGAPLLQALIFHHPEDKLCWHIDDEYYFGNDFLVAPVMNSENRRDVYLPEGQWVNFFTGEVLEGGRWLKDLDVPLDEMPVYVRQGATIPVYPDEVECTDEMDLSKSAELHIDNHFKGIFKD